MKSPKKPRLRRCANCKKPGHNKSTCPEIMFSKPITNQPIRFFVHHVTHDSAPSSHVVDLRTAHHNSWQKVHGVAPLPSSTPHYHFYHQTAVLPTPLMADLHSPADQQPLHSSRVPGVLGVVSRNIVAKTFTLSAAINEIFHSYLTGCHAHCATAIAALWPRHLSRRRALAALVLLATLVSLPGPANSYYQTLKTTADQIVADSTTGFTSLQDSTAALLQADLKNAQNGLNSALASFGNAVNTLQTKHRFLQAVVSAIPILNDEVQSRQQLLLAGQSLALGNTYLVRGITESQSQSDTALTDRLAIFTEHLQAALPNYQKALQAMNKVRAENLPTNYQASFNDFKKLFQALVGDFQNLASLGQTMQEIFGGLGLRRYLLVFQNQNELRPTGGFIGSFAFVEIKDGKIIKLDIPAGGSYDLQGQLDEYLEPPAPLLLTNKRWEFQDANWFPDFAVSAQKLLWFYRHSRNITTDGVIAINATVLERLLAITGPMTETKRQLTLTSDNAVNTLQQIIETGPEKTVGKPKQVLADLASQFVTYFSQLKPRDLLPLLVDLQEALTQKEIQMYFTDNTVQQAVKSFGWSGQVAPVSADQDYLLVVSTNIQGQKSDARVEQTISHQALVQDDGSIIDTVVISRRHTGNDSEQLYGATNIDYLRVYVPKGSELLNASGFSWPDEKKFRVPESWYKKDAWLANLDQETSIDALTGTRIGQEFDKTSFGNWIITPASQTSQIQFTYRLPFKISTQSPRAASQFLAKLFGRDETTSRYQLVLQRQSGSQSVFENQIIFPDGWTPAWKEGDEIRLASNGASIELPDLNRDRIFGLIMKK